MTILFQSPLISSKIHRSLLQKAIRRSDCELMLKVINLLVENNDLVWLKKRFFTILFEECWHVSHEISINNSYQSMLDSYIKICNTYKNKDAAGLGILAYQLSEGDESVLNNSEEDKAIKIVSEAIKRPSDFWKWVFKQPLSEKQNNICTVANKAYSTVGFQWDKSFTIAAAYLSVRNTIPESKAIDNFSKKEFPIWISIDKHTPKGKEVLKKSALECNISPYVASQLSFYLEGAICSHELKSEWFSREFKWKLKELNISYDKAIYLWNKLKPILIKNLESSVTGIKAELLL